jgi:crossover junction endodeoxyribonuclease RuvC
MILGIDPGTAITGWGVIKDKGGKLEPIDFGCIRPKASLPLSQRYLTLHEGLRVLIDRFSPSALAIETQFVQKNVQSAMKLGMARGVIILAATLKGIPVFEYTPTQVKKSVTGRGQASKYQVQGMIATLLGLTTLPEPEDAADALACAICHHHRAHLLGVL